MNSSALLENAAALLDASHPPVTTLSNASALLFDTLERINWAGFYLFTNDALWLGPFQGKPACVRIPYGKGVCGAAFEKNQTLVVPDVHAFPGHIACDSASRSEIVVPLRRDNGAPFGVLDIDSPELNRFSDADRAELEAFAALVSSLCCHHACSVGVIS